MSELNVKPILRQFLLSITGNDIMQTNNDNYDCIDRFIESDRFQVALKQANVVATGGGQLTIPDVSGSAFIAKADCENILVLVDDKYKVFKKLREIGKTWKSITIEQIDKVV